MALRLCLIGQLQVLRDGAAVELPPSKKTRALLAYLVLTGRAHRRARLIDLFWDVADDPRGALRWVLSRLRKVVDEPDKRRIVADRSDVRFDLVDTTVDVLEIREALAGGPESLDTDALQRLAGELDAELLDGLALDDFDAFQAWYLAEREAVAELRVAVLRALVERHADAPEQRLDPLRRLSAVLPLDEDVRASLIGTLVELSRFPEAHQQVQAGRRALEEVGRRPTGRLRAALRVDAPPPAPPPPPPRPAPPPRPPLFGREAEMGALSAWLSEQGRPPALLVGEAGIGKTRLLDAVSDLHDGLVLRATAHEAERRPWGLWCDALAHGGMDDLARLLGDGPDSRDAVTERIAGALASRPDVLVVLDDVQWCDPASAELLHAVQRLAPDVALLLAARIGEIDDHASLLRVLRGLRRRGQLREIAVGPLEPDAVVALVAHHRPERPTDDVVEHAGGNPLYAIELARRDPGEALSSTLAGLVRDRLAHLSDDASSVLRWAAVLGRAVDVDTLAGLVVLDGPDALLEAIDELERAGVLMPGASDGVLRIPHALIQRVVYDGLAVARRRLMHGRAAAVLASRRGTEGIVERVRHATRSGDPRAAVAACLDAGRIHQRLHATTEAAELAHRGLHFAEQLVDPEATERTIELWELSLSARRPEDPERLAGGLASLAERALYLGSAEHARLGFHLAAWVRWEDGDFAEAHRQAMQAERVSRDGASHLVGLAEAAWLLWRLERDLPHAEALLLEAGALARRQGAQHAALSMGWGLLYLHRGFLDQAEEAFAEARERARAAGDALTELEALDHATLLAVRLGGLDDAERLADELVGLTERVRGGSDRAYGLAVQQVVAWMRGGSDPSEALDALGDDPRQRAGVLLCRAAAHALDRGETELARDWAARALARARAQDRPSVAAFAASVLAELGDDEGVEVLREHAGARARALTREVQDRLARQGLPGQPIA